MRKKRKTGRFINHAELVFKIRKKASRIIIANAELVFQNEEKKTALQIDYCQ
jgi:hypothetical protein